MMNIDRQMFAKMGVTLGLVLGWASAASAANGRADYDLDNDGLIEIDDLGDLNDIRNYPDGSRLYNSSTGCPSGGCFGFELSRDLNFDTNNNGRADSGDTYWNAGAGWIPIATFTGEFEGNSHVLRNLFNNPRLVDSELRGGLFALLDGAGVRRLGFEGANLIPGENWMDDGGQHAAPGTGVLASSARLSTIHSVWATGTISEFYSDTLGGLLGTCSDATTIQESYASVTLSGVKELGGLVGKTDDCDIQRSFATGRVYSTRGHFAVGGLVGVLGEGSLIRASFATGNAGHAAQSGALVGWAYGGEIRNAFATGFVLGGELENGGLVGRVEPGATFTIANSYWATNTTGKTTSAGGGLGRTLTELQCSITAGDGACAGLYPSWNLDINTAGQQVWDFGTRQEMPGLRIMGRVFRDADGDGSLDGLDAYRLSYAASLNSDADPATDRWKEGCGTTCQNSSGLTLDQFPSNAAASVDLDLDGRPDAWNASCSTAACRTGSGLTLDTRPGDFDNDGTQDGPDTDDNNDATADADGNSNGLIDVATLVELDAMRNKKTGSGQCLVNCPPEGLNVPPTLGDTSGCPPLIFEGVRARRCQGYELLNDLNFDANGNGLADDPFTPWQPIGYNSDDLPTAFQTVFEGNGHTIANVTISSGNKTGFIGGATDAVVRHVGFIGPLMSVSAGDGGAVVGEGFRVSLVGVYSTGPVHGTNLGNNGGLMGTAVQSSITGSFSTGSVDCLAASGCNRVGGLVGEASFTSISAAFASGDVSSPGGSQLGGLVGLAGESTSISGSYAVGLVNGASEVGGLLGSAAQNVLNSYWARDASNQPSSAGGAVGATLVELQCATPTSGIPCTSTPLYVNWGSYVDSAGLAYWNFGTSTQLPGLCIENKLYRDGNGDGVLDPVGTCGSPAPMVRVDVYDQFTGGYCAHVTMTNTGSTVLDPWVATFSVQGTLNQAWNITYTQTGASVTARPVGWNNRLEPGASTHDIGFCAAL